MNSYLRSCLSCGEEFAGTLPTLVVCPNCVERRERVKLGMRYLEPITAAAKRLYQALQEAMNGRKFVMAHELCTQLRVQIETDREEALVRRASKKAKSERWHSRQPDRRAHDRSVSKSGKK